MRMLRSVLIVLCYFQLVERKLYNYRVCSPGGGGGNYHIWAL